MACEIEMTLTRHAQCRVQQRGIRPAIVALILEHSDWEQHVGGGCISLRLSCIQREHLKKTGISAQLIEMTEKVVLVVGQSGQIVTVLHDVGRRGRRYRPQNHARLH